MFHLAHLSSRARVAVALTALVLIATIPGAVLATHNPNHGASIDATITSPASGAQFTRLDSVAFAGSVTHVLCTPTTTQWSEGAVVFATNTLTASRQFSTLGAKSISFRADGPGGSGCTRHDTDTISITIVNIAPVASATRTGDLVAGVEQTYDASASSDADGSIASYAFLLNNVLMQNGASSVYAFTPTLAGSYSLSVTVTDDNGATASAAPAEFTIAPAALATIGVSGPSTMTVGSSDSFAVSGADAYGNAVTLAQSSFVFDAPTLAGSSTACYEESGITGCADVMVVAGPLASISLAGPDSVVAGASASYTPSGTDAYGNPVGLAQTSVDVTAPTAAGPFTASYTEGSVTGSKPVTAIADALATLSVSGAATMVAGTMDAFSVEGFDQYGNPVILETTSFDFTAPTLVGAAQACQSVGDVTGCADVEVVADVLASVLVSGAESAVAGTTSTYTLSGFDQYGNAVQTTITSFDHAFGTLAGSEDVCASEGDISDCMSVSVVADVLASIVVSGAASLAAGATGTFGVAGFDQYGNSVALAVSSILYTAGQAVGTEVVSYTESGITGSKTIQITPVPLGIAIAMSQTVYNAVDALTNGVSGVVTVGFPGAGGVAGANVTVVILRTVTFVGYAQSETIQGVTDDEGDFAFTPSTAFGLPGKYVIIVRAAALGHTGQSTGSYSVSV